MNTESLSFEPASGQWTDFKARQLLQKVFMTAVKSADPSTSILQHLPPRPTGRCVVVGAGKASAAMAAALDQLWSDVPLTGVVITRDGHAVSAGRIEVL